MKKEWVLIYALCSGRKDCVLEKSFIIISVIDPGNMMLKFAQCKYLLFSVDV